jgi:hypothetical protein
VLLIKNKTKIEKKGNFPMCIIILILINNYMNISDRISDISSNNWWWGKTGKGFQLTIFRAFTPGSKDR